MNEVEVLIKKSTIYVYNWSYWIEIAGGAGFYFTGLMPKHKGLVCGGELLYSPMGTRGTGQGSYCRGSIVTLQYPNGHK